MTQIAIQPFASELEWDGLAAPTTPDDALFTPSPDSTLPTILLTTALLLLLTGATFFVTYFVLAGSLPASVIMTAVLGVLLLGPVNIASAWLTGTPVQLSTLLWSIGLTFGVLFLFGLCSLFGAVAALMVRVAGLG